MLYYRDLIEKALADEGVLNSLKLEEALNDFRSELLKLKYPWELEEHRFV